MKKVANSGIDKLLQAHFLNVNERLLQVIAQGKFIYPEPAEQQKVIKQASEILCSWRVLVNMGRQSIEEVYDSDTCFPFSQPIGIDTFIACIHPSYLVPYLLCAEFAYTFISELGIEPAEIPLHAFQLPVPVKFPLDKDYYWYTQVSNAVSLNEHKVILSHTSCYFFEKLFNPFEYRLIQPAILKNGKLHQSLHDGLLDKFRIHINKS